MKEPQSFEELMEYVTSTRFLLSLLVLAVASALLYVIKQYLIKKVAYTNKDDQHKNTFIGLMFNVMQYVVIIVSGMIIMRIHGISITSILAGLGIIATIVGLALQDTLKDIIAGINIYNNNFYKVGDMVRYNGQECDVKYFSARVTKFQALVTKSTFTVCNSQITSIEKIKDSKSLTFLFHFDDDEKKIEKAMTAAIEKVKAENKNMKSASYGGIWNITTDGVMYGIAYTAPAHKYTGVRSLLLKYCYEEFKKASLTPVFNKMMD
ncbi:MAG: mechanosensitive ion channel family protein [Erysipelotrichaceae bacterium]|nr:mechanosensitive ion channel family protein [Erysipelotrichaceae bacterium]